MLVIVDITLKFSLNFYIGGVTFCIMKKLKLYQLILNVKDGS